MRVDRSEQYVRYSVEQGVGTESRARECRGVVVVLPLTEHGFRIVLANSSVIELREQRVRFR